MFENPSSGGNSTFFGQNAGLATSGDQYNTFIGKNSGRHTTSGGNNTFIGGISGFYNITGTRNTFIGESSGYNSTGSENTFIGYRSGHNETGSNKLYIENSNSTTPLIYGEFDNDLLRINGTLQATEGYTDADNDTKIQVEETTDEDKIRFDTDGSQRMIINNNGFVGVGSGNPTANLTVMGSATTNTEIAHFSNSNNAKKAIISLSNNGAGQMALLDGSNNTDVLLSTSANSYFNAANLGVGNNNPQEKLHVTGNIRMEDGNQGVGKVMTSDANGKATWQIPSASADIITDADNDTKIQVEETADEDIIRFDVGGTERWRMTNSRIEPQNSGNSVFIGKNAGLVDDLNNNVNVFIGFESGQTNTTGSTNIGLGAYTLNNNIGGSHNTALGSSASAQNTTGNSNVAIGKFTLFDNQTGSNNVAIGAKALEYGGSADENNVAIGFEAGYNADGSNNVFIGNKTGKNISGSNRLIIDNTSTTTPLIYGEFDNDLVRVNGDLKVTETITTYGNVVLAANPGATTKLGVTGTVISYIIKVDVSEDIGSIPSDGHINVDFSVPNAKTGSSVMISPELDLPNQVFIGQARVVSNGTVRVRFHNESNSSKDPGNMDFYITVIK